MTGHEAIGYAIAHDLTLSKYADPTEGAIDGLTADDALVIADEDPALIYLSAVEAAVGWLSETVSASDWDRLVGSQTRREFAELTIDRGETIEQAWADYAAWAAATNL